MFQAFCNIYSEYDYTKRDKSVIKENVYDRMARECVNAKKRQDTQKAKIIPNVVKHIEKHGLDKNKIILCNTDELLTKEMTGLLCIEIAKRFKRPALLYRTRINEAEGGEKVVTYEGSGRNYDDFDLKNLLPFLQESGLFTYAEGHDNAMGIGFIPENEGKIIDLFNTEFAEYDVDGAYTVDFIIDFVDLDDSVFIEMDKLSGLYGHKVDEPLWAITNISISLNKIEIIKGKTNTTVKFIVDNVEFVRFKVNEEDVFMRILDDWDYESNEGNLNVIGHIGINTFGGRKSLQVIVNDWEFIRGE